MHRTPVPDPPRARSKLHPVRYIEIIATIDAPDAERAAELLRELSGSGVWIEAPFVQHDLESDAIVDRSAPVRIHAYLPESGDAATIERAAVDALQAAAIGATLARRAVAEEDWAESWKEHFHVERYGERIVVVPSWLRYAPAAGDVVIALDPGMAFGTGQHETTRMCLEALELAVRNGMRVLDVGCGSGILSIAAAKLGAREVLAIDVDPNCVRVTDENARANGVERIVRAATGSAGEGWPFASAARGASDLVVANIIARVIIELAQPLVEALAPGGRIIASGIIGEREHEVTDALAAAGARTVSSRAMGDWRCIEAVCAEDAP
jgi:ribosomal protein L11 methyltransferase